MNVQIAFYHGPSDNFKGWLSDLLISIGTWSPITHCELVLHGRCYSSSGLDGGVRVKDIDLNSGKWELFEVSANEDEMMRFITETMGSPYDFRGIVQFAIPFVKSNPDEWFCSEWVAEAIGNPIRADKLTPKDLYEWAQKHGRLVRA